MLADQLLDAQGMNCPLPIIKTRKALQAMTAGSTLEVLATDPGATADFQAFCRMTGHELLEQGESGGVYRFVLKKVA